MTRDDIIRLASEAGFVIDEKARQHQPNCIFHTHHMIDEGLTRFAALVAAAEREACELTVDSLIISGPVSEVQQRHNWAYMHARDAIRARDET